MEQAINSRLQAVQIMPIIVSHLEAEMILMKKRIRLSHGKREPSRHIVGDPGREVPNLRRVQQLNGDISCPTVKVLARDHVRRCREMISRTTELKPNEPHVW